MTINTDKIPSYTDAFMSILDEVPWEDDQSKLKEKFFLKLANEIDELGRTLAKKCNDVRSSIAVIEESILKQEYTARTSALSRHVRDVFTYSRRLEELKSRFINELEDFYGPSFRMRFMTKIELLVRMSFMKKNELLKNK